MLGPILIVLGPLIGLVLGCLAIEASRVLADLLTRQDATDEEAYGDWPHDPTTNIGDCNVL
jgi:hypothetical protein